MTTYRFFLEGEEIRTVSADSLDAAVKEFTEMEMVGYDYCPTFEAFVSELSRLNELDDTNRVHVSIEILELNVSIELAFAVSEID